MGIPARHVAYVGGRRAGKRAAAGRTSQRVGAQLEEYVVASAGVPRRCRWLRLYRIPSGAKFIGPGKIIPVPSPFDFGGCIGPGGRCLAFDAKRVEGEALRLNDPAVVKPHQLQALAALAENGAVAGLLVECCRLEQVVWMPALQCFPLRRVHWDDPAWLWLGSTKFSINWPALAAAYNVPWPEEGAV